MNNNDKTKIFCNKCRHFTIHELLYSHVLDTSSIDSPDADFDYYNFSENPGVTRVYLWACRGCEQATLQEVIEDEAGEEIGSEFYPAREKRHLIQKSFLQLNAKLSKIYEEVITCYNAEIPILCATGLRALLEGICDDKGIEGRNLFTKINNLDSLLPKNIVESLHYFRSIGNDAVHELSAPSMAELRSTIEVMEDILNFLYDLDYKAANLSRIAGTEIGKQQIQPSVEKIKLILNRSPKLSQGPKTLFQVLYEAGNQGLSYVDMASKTDRETAQIAGILGALGRRINNTAGIEGKPGVTYLFEYVDEVNGEPGAWGWRMRYELEQVIKNGNYPWAKDWK